MARIIEALDNEWVEWVPDYDGNRDDDDPVSMELKPMTAAEYRESQRMLAQGNMKKIMERSQKLILKTVSARVRNVKNYVVYGETIETGGQLAKSGEPQLVDQVYEALHNISTLRSGLKKKSRSPSDSSRPTTTRHGGGDVVAAPVTPREIKSVGLGTVTATQTQGSAGSGPQN